MTPIITVLIEKGDQYKNDFIVRIRRRDGKVVFTGTRDEFDDHCFMRSLGFHVNPDRGNR